MKLVNRHRIKGEVPLKRGGRGKKNIRSPVPLISRKKKRWGRGYSWKGDLNGADFFARRSLWQKRESVRTKKKRRISECDYPEEKSKKERSSNRKEQGILAKALSARRGKRSREKRTSSSRDET